MVFEFKSFLLFNLMSGSFFFLAHEGRLLEQVTARHERVWWVVKEVLLSTPGWLIAFSGI
jgi:hypothetical protein